MFHFNPRLGLAIVAALGLSLAACSSDDPPPIANTTAPAAPITSDRGGVVTPNVPVSASPSSAGLRLGHEAQFSLRSQTGYTAFIQVRQGELRPAVNAPINGTAPLGRACQLDPATSAVVPFAVSITNTSNFGAFRPRVTLNTLRPSAEYTMDGVFLHIELSLSTGSACYPVQQAGTYPEIAPSGELPTNQSSTVYGWLVATQYRTPARPEGNPALLANAVVAVDAPAPDRVSGGDGSKRLPGGLYGFAWDPAAGSSSCLVKGTC